jgi:Ser/Thr protein kinase RdoA (MazF antagonist)
MLEQSGIAHYLLSLGLVKPQAVIEEDLSIVDASRRNSVFVAVTSAGPAYVVKQAGPRSAHTLAHEAAVLRALADAGDLGSHVPRVVHHEPEAARLVLCTPGGAQDWSLHHGAGRFPRIPARGLGRLLARIHRLRADQVKELPSGVDPMWGLSLPEPPRALLLDLSAGAQDVVARLQANEPLCRRLAELRESRSDAAFVHGDVRWDNCLAVAARGSRRRTRVLLVDWELAGNGSPAFDVGSVLAEYLTSWVGSIPIVDPSDPGRLTARAARPLPRMEAAVQAFWSAYAAASPRCPPLRSAIELTAVRLLQSAVERAQMLARPTASVIALVQLAEHMLRHPDLVGYTLLGLRA